MTSRSMISSHPSLPAPSVLTVGEGFHDPLGFHDPAPTLSWQLPADGSLPAQAAYRIVAASAPELLPERADLWDSGDVTSERSAWIRWAGEPLAARQRVHWQVRIRDPQGRQSAWSAPATFELGLLRREDWQAAWIRMDDSAAPDADHFVPQHLRRAFCIERPVRQARLYVTARGFYDIHLNGQTVGDDLLAPGWTPYRKRIETRTYDVTDHIQDGDNLLGAVLGEGWYATRMNRDYDGSFPKLRPALLARLEIVDADGAVTAITTDDAWKATDTGPIRHSGIYHGEDYDARREMPGWDAPGFDDTAWSPVCTEPLDPDVALSPKRHRPVRVTEYRAAAAVTEPEPERFVFDLGQNMVGRPRVRIPVTKNRPVTIRFAEMLQQDGTLYTENYRGARSTNTYLPAADGTVEWAPLFTFHGFRYVELSGLPANASPRPDWVVGEVMHSDIARTGTFTSSHAKLNQLQRNIDWGLRGNFVDIPTDCPQRDERLGWTGDAQVFCPTSMFNRDAYAFWAAWLQTVREEQRDDGYIPHVAPDTLGRGGAPGWGDVAVVTPWDLYVRTGDRTILEDNYAMMTAWTEAYVRDATDGIVEREGFGDWLQPYPESGTNRGDTPMVLITTAYFGRCADLMSRAADALSRPDEADRYRRLHADIRSAFSRTFFDADGRLTTQNETQTGYLMALGFDLLEPELRDGAITNLVRLVGEADGRLRTGFLGTPLITAVLDRIGHPELACDVLFADAYPSWFCSIDQGATTMWERWNSYSHENGFGDASMNSFNHYAYGCVGQWMVERLAGLAPDPDAPGYRHILVRPLFAHQLTAAAASQQTPYGMAKAAWKRCDHHIEVTVTVPPNTTATAILPAGPKNTVTADGGAIPAQRQEQSLVVRLHPGTHTLALT